MPYYSLPSILFLTLLMHAVFMMARMEEDGSLPDAEKQDVCHLATMLMQIGMNLAQCAEDQGSDAVSNSNSNPLKKRRQC